MSARACLLGAGAAAVVVVTAARIVRPTFAEDIGADDYLVAARKQHDLEHWVRDSRPSAESLETNALGRREWNP